MWVAHSINIREHSEPQLVLVDQLPERVITNDHGLKHKVCQNLPFKVLSETLDESVAKEYGLCVVTYGGQKLAISDLNEIMTSSVDLFRNTPLRYEYGGLSNREIMGVIYELPKPEHRYFYYRPKHFFDAQIYLLRVFDRLSKGITTYKKYGHKDFHIYVWEGVNSDGEKNVSVQIFSNDLGLGCRGITCLDYLREVNIL